MTIREQRLLLGFCAVLLLSATWLFGSSVAKKSARIEENTRDLNLRWAEIETLISQEDLWLKRSEWLDKTQPRFTTEEDVHNTLLATISAKKEPGITTKVLELLEPVETPDYVQVGVRFQVSGPLPAVFGWLHGLQKPERFRAVRSLKAVPHKEEPNVVDCDVELVRWYAPKTES